MYVTSEEKRPKSRGDGRRAHVTAVSEEEQPVCDEKMHARRHRPAPLYASDVCTHMEAQSTFASAPAPSNTLTR